MTYWKWSTAGAALAGAFLLAVVLVKPIGVSTQFVILDGIIARLVHPQLVQVDEAAKSGYTSTNAYLNKSGGKYAKSIANPVNYSFVFVLAMFLGGLVSRFTRKDRRIEQMPTVHKERFGDRVFIRYLLAFVGGVIVLWGARLAGGCTSGHMMSGIMQTSISGYLFALSAFAAGVPTAMILYGKKKEDR